MFNRYATAALALCASTSAAPLTDLAKRQGQNIDVTVLQFALTLEHLENTFYRQAVQKFDEQDFEDAGELPHTAMECISSRANVGVQASQRTITTT